MKIKVINKIKNLSTEPMLRMYVDSINHDIQYVNTEGCEGKTCTITLKMINQRPHKETDPCCPVHLRAIDYALSKKGEEDRKAEGIKPFLET
jgi:hypothetical protein